MILTLQFAEEASIEDLWNLDVIGITDSTQRKTKEEEDFMTKMNFLNSVTVNAEGRYEVALPWKEEYVPLSSNKDLAKRRLEKMTNGLNSKNLHVRYDEFLEEWYKLCIIEEVPLKEIVVQSHDLPHKPVVIQYGTTKIRLVFDASAREISMPSLNKCLNSSPNLLELIPNLVLNSEKENMGSLPTLRKLFCK
ncbi:uncharacterized protein LOC129228843 [Uloborus diversus]|uniref:uncharacterized protein LOC129228843 n=1 Tax=Uloborus diversus TaxID=327109 RepID=UPI00240A56B3|nr:uncharacterized protein LOC129228843 [Uloborus diversus]